jgi:cysteinyl-tRNA synthetase
MLKIYNTLTQKKEAFKPRDGKKVNLFVCGPTVYDSSHIGHARTYLAFDVIVKWLKRKYTVTYLQNITDLDDKIIHRAGERKTTPKQLAEKYEKEYLDNMNELGIDSVTKYAKATDHIKEIISQVQTLSEKDYAYSAEDGIYYDIKKFKGYGKLSKRTALQAEDGVSRIDEGKKKRNKGDFCLWKFSRPDEPEWDSPWGKGRPGWHIEDTAITEKNFGPQYDIHGGARDLIFPHHEAEIAQMEAISGKPPLVRYWMHTGFLTVSGQKMSKSLGNFITIADFLKKNSARVLRLLIIKAHYRSPIDYSEKSILQAKKELERMDEFTGKLKNLEAGKKAKTANLLSASAFEAIMDDDFNTPKAVAFIFDLIKKGNALLAKNNLGKTEAKKILDFLEDIDKVFGFIFLKKEEIRTPSSVQDLANLREKYRKEGNWEKADEVRDEIQKAGFRVEDTKDGPKLKKI